MSRASTARRLAGFTLVEVLVAMVVVALGIGALLATLSSSADTVGRLRERTLAQWVALNRISEVRLDAARPGTGTTQGDVEFAGTQWRWQQVITEQDVEGILRIDVAVAAARATAAAPAAGDDADNDFPALAKVSGFIATSAARSSGLDPDWGLPQPRNPGEGNPSGGQPSGEGGSAGGGGLPGGGGPPGTGASRREP